jgi:hypothetical protein
MRTWFGPGTGTGRWASWRGVQGAFSSIARIAESQEFIDLSIKKQLPASMRKYVETESKFI